MRVPGLFTGAVCITSTLTSVITLKDIISGLMFKCITVVGTIELRVTKSEEP